MPRRGRHQELLAAFLFLWGSTPAFAGTVTCSGTVAYLGYHANGTVLMRLSSMNTWVMVCSLDASWDVAPGFVTTPASCKTIYATLLIARLSGNPVNDVYFDGPSVPAACNSWQTWTSANIRAYQV
jgi:hypothetical protein